MLKSNTAVTKLIKPPVIIDKIFCDTSFSLSWKIDKNCKKCGETTIDIDIAIINFFFTKLTLSLWLHD